MKRKKLDKSKLVLSPTIVKGKYQTYVSKRQKNLAKNKKISVIKNAGNIQDFQLILSVKEGEGLAEYESRMIEYAKKVFNEKIENINKKYKNIQFVDYSIGNDKAVQLKVLNSFKPTKNIFLSRFSYNKFLKIVNSYTDEIEGIRGALLDMIGAVLHTSSTPKKTDIPEKRFLHVLHAKLKHKNGKQFLGENYFFDLNPENISLKAFIYEGKINYEGYNSEGLKIYKITHKDTNDYAKITLNGNMIFELYDKEGIKYKITVDNYSYIKIEAPKKVRDRAIEDVFNNLFKIKNINDFFDTLISKFSIEKFSPEMKFALIFAAINFDKNNINELNQFVSDFHNYIKSKEGEIDIKTLKNILVSLIILKEKNINFKKILANLDNISAVFNDKEFLEAVGKRYIRKFNLDLNFEYESFINVLQNLFKNVEAWDKLEDSLFLIKMNEIAKLILTDKDLESVKKFEFKNVDKEEQALLNFLLKSNRHDLVENYLLYKVAIKEQIKNNASIGFLIEAFQKLNLKILEELSGYKIGMLIKDTKVDGIIYKDSLRQLIEENRLQKDILNVLVKNILGENVYDIYGRNLNLYKDVNVQIKSSIKDKFESSFYIYKEIKSLRGFKKFLEDKYEEGGKMLYEKVVNNQIESQKKLNSSMDSVKNIDDFIKNISAQKAYIDYIKAYMNVVSLKFLPIIEKSMGSNITINEKVLQNEEQLNDFFDTFLANYENQDILTLSYKKDKNSVVKSSSVVISPESMRRSISRINERKIKEEFKKLHEKNKIKDNILLNVYESAVLLKELYNDFMSHNFTFDEIFEFELLTTFFKFDSIEVNSNDRKIYSLLQKQGDNIKKLSYKTIGATGIKFTNGNNQQVKFFLNQKGKVSRQLNNTFNFMRVLIKLEYSG